MLSRTASAGCAASHNAEGKMSLTSALDIGIQLRINAGYKRLHINPMLDTYINDGSFLIHSHGGQGFTKLSDMRRGLKDVLAEGNIPA